MAYYIGVLGYLVVALGNSRTLPPNSDRQIIPLSIHLLRLSQPLLQSIRHDHDTSTSPRALSEVTRTFSYRMLPVIRSHLFSLFSDIVHFWQVESQEMLELGETDEMRDSGGVANWREQG